MNRTLSILTEGQDPQIQKQMNRRVSALIARVRYMRASKAEYYVEIERQGWTLERLETLFALNAFYLFVLGPLASSSRRRSQTMWRSIPILYGDELLFDEQRARKIRKAHASFSTIANRVPGGLDTLCGNQASDIVFRLYRALNGDPENRSLG
jgi:hypothetical protein